MKFFLAFLQSSVKYDIPAYQFWEFYMKNGIEEGGYSWSECVDVDWAKGLLKLKAEDRKKWKEISWEKTLAFLKKDKPDVFLSYFFPEQIDMSAIAEIRKSGIFCVNFFCDNIRNFRSAPKEFGCFDVNWVPEYRAVQMYKKAGFSHINLPMPMWVDPADRYDPVKENGRYSFIGSRDIQRQILFESLFKKNPDLPLDLYGYGWKSNNISNDEKVVLSKKIINQVKFIRDYGINAFWNKIESRKYEQALSETLQSRSGRILNAAEYIKITKNSNVTIGVNRFPSFQMPFNTPLTYSRLRDIEAPMLGACYLTEWAPGIESLYEVGKDILVYRNSEELFEKLHELQTNINLRMSLRENAQRKALERHSIPASLKKILKLL